MKRLHRPLLIVWLGLVAPAPPWAAPAPATSRCCQAAAGTQVQLELTEDISTKARKAGDAFAFRLAKPLVISGQIVVPAGAVGQGVVVEATKPGFGGKGAKLVVSARYLTYGGAQIPLQSLQLAAVGKGRSDEANVAGMAGIAFAPLGVAAMAIKGGDALVPKGTVAMAKLAAAVTLPSLGRAPAGTLSSPVATPAAAPLGISPPPPGKGQIVFFRKTSLTGTGQWFNVRENGKALGKLSNGVYFVWIADPGVHDFTASSEPEFKDRLRLQVDPGETYFVEGAYTKGMVLGAANLAPSTSQAFNSAAKALKAAEAGG